MDIIRILMSFTGAFAFSLLFNIKGKRLIFASLGGLLCGLVFYFSSYLSEREVLYYFAASMAVNIYSEIAARLLKTPATTFLGAGIIPLVPGGTLYLTMSEAIHGDLDNFFNLGMEAAYIALSIAAGILVVSPLKRVLDKIMEIGKNNLLRRKKY